MISPSLLIGLSLGLVGLLFAIAWYGDRHEQRLAPWQPWIYSLSLAVYCTSWAFYGTVNQAATYGWFIPPTYVGTMLLFALAHGFLRRLYRLTRQHHLTSIADFIAARYGKRPIIAVLITVIATFAVLPYIALQLKAVASSYRLLTGLHHPADSHWWLDTGFYVAILMAGFAILFGTRQAAVTEHQPGLILAVAFESLFKLLAFLIVSATLVWGVGDGLALLDTANELLPIAGASGQSGPRFMTLAVLGVTAMFCLPRQFYVGFVECHSGGDLKTARVALPVYLLLMSLFTLPVAWVGIQQYGALGVDADTYLLRLPLDAGYPMLALFAYLGGFAAATSMVILASVALSVMISNDLVLPWWLRYGRRAPVMTLRRVAILVVLMLAWLYYRYLGESEALAAMGGVAFAGVAQFAPAIVLGVYWRGATAMAAMAGLLVGFALWLWTLMLPIVATAGLLNHDFVSHGPWGVAWLRPQALLGVDGLDPLAHGVLFSLGVNGLVFLLTALLKPAGLDQRRAAVAFLSGATAPADGMIQARLLADLLHRFVGWRAVEEVFGHAVQASVAVATVEQVGQAERMLAGVLGAASARTLLTALTHKRDMEAAEVAAIVGQAGEALQFNRELLAAMFDHISQGVSVVDRNLCLVAWNQRYSELFEYPPGLLRPGRPVADLVRYNARRGWCGPGLVEDHVQKRLHWLRQGTHHRFERERPDGVVLQMSGQPLPGGGFVTTFNDVTEYKNNQRELEQLNRALEARVRERTAELEGARNESERANRSKSRFLAATSHDLAQPLNAARLLVNTLENRRDNAAPDPLLAQLSQVLDHAEELLAELQEISRLERGMLAPRHETLTLTPLLQQLQAEFEPMAQARGLRLRVVDTLCSVRSDERLLRRILQNLLANAVRYTRQGGIVLGVRRHGQNLRIQVWDSGEGIADDQHEIIFQEFRRGEEASGGGLGLGLAIARRLAGLLNHPLGFVSRPGLGSVFFIDLPRAHADGSAPRPKPSPVTAPVAGQPYVWCVDDDPTVLSALCSWLESQGCRVRSFTSAQAMMEAVAAVAAGESGEALDMVIADYHLGQGEDGLYLIQRMRRLGHVDLPAVIVSADTSDAVREQVAEAGIVFMAKPLKPLALRSVLQRLLRAVR